MPASQTDYREGPQRGPDAEEIRAMIAPCLALEGPLLPMLHALQEAYGYVPQAAHGPITDALNITRAELHGVLSFYHDFRDSPPARHVIRICRSEACQAVGGADLSARVLELLGLGWGGTTPDGRISVEPVYCLGLCATGPAAMVDGKLRGRARAEALVAEVAS